MIKLSPIGLGAFNTQRYGIARLGSILNRGFSQSLVNYQKAPGKRTEEKIQPKISPRQPKILQRMSEFKEDLYTLPNLLTYSRLIATPVIGYLVVKDQVFWAASLFVYSCFTDLLDGYIARKYKMTSVVGSVVDPLADKALMITLTSCLAVSGQIPVYVASLILGRDILLGLSAFYYRYISLPPPKTLHRYFDFSIPSAEVHPTTISKYNTFFQMVYLGSSLVLPAIDSSIDSSVLDSLHVGLQGLEYLVATTTVLSGLSYVFSKDAVKILPH